MKRGAKLFDVVCLGTPRPKARPRFVKGRVVSTVGDHELLWRGTLEKEIRHAWSTSKKPFDCALIVDASFYFEAKKADRLGLPHTQRPDKDNLEKLCLDVLKKERVIKDDALVVGGETTKEWQMNGGAVIAVYEALAG
jgi:Holliday junction resolvase RusA-like endonuclease